MDSTRDGLRCRKPSLVQKILASVTAVLLMAASTTGVYANPTGGTVTTGSGSIVQNGSTTTINQTTNKLGINWQSFSIGAGEKVVFQQPTAASVALNRVLSTQSSAIYGQLSANGKVFLINPNGLLFAPTAQVNVGGLVASTLNISDSNFLAGNYAFNGTTGFVTNQGSMKTANGGYVVLLGQQVKNEGTIVANLGTIALGAGKSVTMSIDGKGLVNLAVGQAAANGSVANSSLLQADGGRVVMTTQTYEVLTGSVVNNTGLIKATSVKINSSGDVMLCGSVSINAANGNLDVSANRNIAIAAAITNSGNNAVVTLRSGKQGDGIGTVNFYSGGTITQGSTGKTTIYYNPSSYVAPTDYSGNISGGSLTAYMLVNTVNQLQNMNINLSGTYALGRNINAGATKYWNSGAGFVPIGTAADPFMGTLNGNCYSISNLYINRPTESGVGLFGNIFAGTITNIGLNNISVTGNSDVGGLAGYIEGYINNSYSTGTVKGTYAVGGLVGVKIGGNINNSYSAGTVSGDNDVGGLVGETVHGSINNSYSMGAVTGVSEIGGLVGFNEENDINNSYSGGVVTGGSMVGGLVGINFGGIINNSYSKDAVTGYIAVGGLVGKNIYGNISNSYSTGNVSGDDSYTGGLVGQSDSGSINNSYSTGAVYGDIGVGGLAGSNGGVITNSYSTSTVFGSRGVGGLVGGNTGSITNSYNLGIVDGYLSVGGIAGSNSGSISNSYNQGAVEGYLNVGGLVGYNNGGSIINSYSTGGVSGDLKVGGLIGTNLGGSVNNGYWDITTSGQATSDGGTGLTTAQMKNKASYSGWDFATIWNISPGSYPYLR